MPLDIFDLVIIGVILFSAIIGLFRGFIRETLSLVSWILAFVAAFNYRLDIISWFDGIIDNQMYQQIVSADVFNRYYRNRSSAGPDFWIWAWGSAPRVFCHY